MLRTRDIIGIFDIERTTESDDTDRFLINASRRGSEVGCTDDLPRSFIVTFNMENLDEKVYISRIAAGTLKRRCMEENL